MCTQPHPIAEKAYKMFLRSNLGDPALFPGATQLEREVVDELAGLLHGRGCVGNIVTGGTEANLMALHAARNRANAKEPEVILPESAHFSFAKICRILSLKPVYAGLDASMRVDTAEVKALMNEHTVAVVATAGTTELGVIDPIEELADVAAESRVWFHVDAAFGGLVIPFLSDPKPAFDFSLDAVESVTVDPHKMGLSAIPAGGILFRHEADFDSLKVETPYLNGDYQRTFTGTRSGAAAASAWAVFKLLGIEGYRKIVGKCMKTTRFLADGLAKAGFQLVVEPQLNIVAFRREEGTKRLAESLRRQGWFISYVPRHDCIRIVVMPHVNKRHAAAFLRDLPSIEKL